MPSKRKEKEFLFSTSRPSISAALRAVNVPLPGFAELQQVAKSLVDDMKVCAFRCPDIYMLEASLSLAVHRHKAAATISVSLFKRIEGLLDIVQEFGESQYLDLSEMLK